MIGPVIDTHIHTWDFGRAQYPWLVGDRTILNRNYLLEELNPQATRSHISYGVLVQAANNAEDTALMLETAENNTWILGVVGWLPLMDPKRTEQWILKKFTGNHYLKGIRHLIHDEADPAWLLQPEVLESLQIVARHNLTYDVVGVTGEHLKTAIAIATAIPELNIVLDHLNHPPVDGQKKTGSWGTLMSEAATHKNIFCKISGLGTLTGKPQTWTADDIRPYIVFAINAFGTDRCICGGDWPVSLLAGSYEKTWMAYRKILSEELSEEDQKKILFTNARDFYNLATG
jgi:L-fuconolactonase